jgi:hypothetical protein
VAGGKEAPDHRGTLRQEDPAGRLDPTAMVLVAQTPEVVEPGVGRVVDRLEAAHISISATDATTLVGR